MLDKKNTAKSASPYSLPLTRISKLWQWWPLLLGPSTMLTVYTAYFAKYPGFYNKRIHETLALIILSLVVLNFLSCALLYRRLIHIVLSVLTAALFCREWHFAGTSTGIYIALALIGIWSFVYRKKLMEAIKSGPLKSWLNATFLTYILSQLIARRVFRSLLPMENELHVPLEEVVETTAHLMLLVASIIAWRYPYIIREIHLSGKIRNKCPEIPAG